MRKFYNNLSSIILCLSIPKLMVFPGFVCNKIVMVALLHDLSVIKHIDFIAEPTRGKPMTDINGIFIANNFVKFRIHFVFCNRVKSGGRFVKNNKRSAFI